MMGLRQVGPGGTLVLLRHGQSTANAADEFTGWLDAPLTGQGESEARGAAKLLWRHRLRPDVVHTSLLTRSIRTADLVLTELGGEPIPVQRTWRLNERHYGALQGRDKDAVKAEVGLEIYTGWRRSYLGTPPPLSRLDPRSARVDPRYAHLPSDALPDTESLADVRSRLLPYWYDVVAADLYAGRLPLVVAHGNSLRALVMHLDRLSAEQVERLNLPTGIPLLYELGPAWRPVHAGGRYLDPTAAAAALAEVEALGGT
jgi:2,3-bisphosphoglycerate-dependent phosphoglycerate mutase